MLKPSIVIFSVCTLSMILSAIVQSANVAGQVVATKYEALCIGVGSEPGDIYVTRNTCFERGGLRRVETATKGKDGPSIAISDAKAREQYIISGSRVEVIKGVEIKDTDARALLDLRISYPFLSLKRSEAEFVRLTFPPVSYTHLTLPTTPYV